MASTTTENAVTSSSPTFTVGQLVNVASRTWSGINQPGGVGRILALHHHQTPTTTTTAHVRYILDSRQEKNVELKYIQPYHIESSRLRNRNMLLGRCSRCGSLRKDCNSCDVLWADEQEEMTAPASSKQVPKKRQRTVKEEQQQQLLLSSSDDDASSSSGDSLQNYLDEQRRRERIFQRLKKQAERVLPPGKQVNAQSSRKIRKQNKQKTPKQSKQRVVVEQRSVLETLGSSPARPKEKVANHDTVSSPGTIDDSSDSEKRASDRHSRADDFGSQDASESDDMNPFFESGDDEDDDHADDDYAMLSQGFLEPDDARLLPTDIVDRTRDLAFDQLGPFIRQIIDELKREEIPSASSSLVELERRFQKASTVEEKKALLSDW